MSIAEADRKAKHNRILGFSGKVYSPVINKKRLSREARQRKQDKRDKLINLLVGGGK